MRHGSLFSGIGGFDLAAEWAGFENVFHCEYDRKARAVLEKRFPDSVSIHDVRDIYRYSHEYRDLYGDGEELFCDRHGMDFADCDCIGCSQWDDEIGAIDILTAGFPCQPFSHNGKRQGTNDERNLWPETARIIRELRPRWFIGENVPGLATWNNGEVLATIKSDLEGAGYEMWTFNIPATAVGGSHIRERLWFVAHDKSQRIQGVRPTGQQEPQPLVRTLLPLRRSNGEWEVEPDLRRANDGVSGGMDRLKLLGNAIVPSIAFMIFETIKEYEKSL
jgi:DNA (cytosine-5)-methyltransferase 1